MKSDNLFPFQRVWYDRSADWDSYDKIVVTPVDTTHLIEEEWMSKAFSIDKERVGKAREIARFLRQNVILAFQKAPSSKNRFQVAPHRGPKTLVLEMALVEIVPPKEWLNAVGMIAGRSRRWCPRRCRRR